MADKFPVRIDYTTGNSTGLSEFQVGETIPVANGGTGSTTAADARTALGLAIGTNVQAYDADLTTWAGITPAANVGTFLTTPSSANFKAAITDETGSGLLVFGTSPTFTTSIITDSASFDLINTTATTVNFAKAATVLSIGSATGSTTINNALTVTGNLTVNGTSITVNSTTMTVDDPIITLGGETAPEADDNKDRGVEFRWHNGSVAKVGFFGYDDSTGYFTFIPSATNTSEVFSGTMGDFQATNFRGALVGNADTATKSTNIIGGNNTTLLGSIPYQSNTDVTSLLSPNTTSTKKFLRQTGTGTNGAAPAWDTLVDGDIPTTLTSKTLSAPTLTGEVTIGTAALATSATTGFPWIPSMAGTPTGTPTEPYDHATALTWDYTNKVLYANTDAAWSPVSLPADSQVGFRNKLINGDFQIWQRGTSFTDPTTNTTAYCADRWQAWRGSFTAGITTAQQTVQANSKSIRVQRNSGNASTATLNLAQTLETIEAKKLAGKSVILSFNALAGSNFSSASSLISVKIVYGTGTNQSYVTGFTGASDAASTTKTLTTTNTKFTLTASIPANATEVAAYFYYTPDGTASTNDYFEVTDVQLEEGSVATPFERRPYGLELALCQRYFRRLVNKAGNWSGGNGVAISTTGLQAQRFFETEMRVAPALTISAATDFIVISSTGGSSGSASAITLGITKNNFVRFDVTVGSGLTAGDACSFQSQNTSATLDLDAEL